MSRIPWNPRSKKVSIVSLRQERMGTYRNTGVDEGFPRNRGQLEVFVDDHFHKTTNHESAADEECGEEDVKRRELRVGEPITASGESESP
jgi:hypothetical protein